MTRQRALLAISIAVFLATSTWFSGTAVVPHLRIAWSLSSSQSAALTSAVQFGFIMGTLGYALTSLADIKNPRWVFAGSAWAGAALNLAFAWLSPSFEFAIGFRFALGVTLAGVYPVGMKLVATWFASPPTGQNSKHFDKNTSGRPQLGWQLGVMVSALTLGTCHSRRSPPAFLAKIRHKSCHSNFPKPPF